MTDYISQLPCDVLRTIVQPYLQPDDLISLALVNVSTYQSVSRSAQFQAIRRMTCRIHNLQGSGVENLQIIRQYVPTLWCFICYMRLVPSDLSVIDGSNIYHWDIESTREFDPTAQYKTKTKPYKLNIYRRTFSVWTLTISLYRGGGYEYTDGMLWTILQQPRYDVRHHVNETEEEVIQRLYPRREYINHQVTRWQGFTARVRRHLCMRV